MRHDDVEGNKAMAVCEHGVGSVGKSDMKRLTRNGFAN
jgi:hypothetical protein